MKVYCCLKYERGVYEAPLRDQKLYESLAESGLEKRPVYLEAERPERTETLTNDSNPRVLKLGDSSNGSSLAENRPLVQHPRLCVDTAPRLNYRGFNVIESRNGTARNGAVTSPK